MHLCASEDFFSLSHAEFCGQSRAMGCSLEIPTVGCFSPPLLVVGKTVIFCSLCKQVCCKRIIFARHNPETQHFFFFFPRVDGSTRSLPSLAWSEWTRCVCHVCSTRWKESLLMNDGALCCQIWLFFFLPSAYLFLFIYLPLKREKYLKGLDDFFFFFW